jgi:hypothetical protein
MPILSLLQLDTGFPRIAGDVASPETWCARLEPHVMAGLSVRKVITTAPCESDVAGIESVLADARGDVITTSCGFLGIWQDRLAGAAPAPFIASSLVGLLELMDRYGPDELAILTFDAATLMAPAFGRMLNGFAGPVIGLPATSHLKQVIADDLPQLDRNRAESEIIDLVACLLAQRPVRALVLECTNLPPYKAALKKKFDIEIFDILTQIHLVNPDIVNPAFR